MPQNVHVFQHIKYEGPGRIIDWALSRGIKLSTTDFWQNQQAPPVTEPDMLVIMGGFMSVNDEEKFPWLVEEKKFIRKFISSGRPVLGICLGAQMLASALGNKVYPIEFKEIGFFPVKKENEHPLFDGFPVEIPVFHWHGETFDMPEGAVHTFSNGNCPNQGFVLGNTVGLQFHIEIPQDDIVRMAQKGLMELNEDIYVMNLREIIANSYLANDMHEYLYKLLDRMIEM